MKELEKILEDPKVSEDVKRTVQSMNKDGMQLLNDYYDENLIFINELNLSLLQINSMQIQVKLKIYIIILPMKHLKNSIFIYFLIGSIHYMNDDKEIKYVYELMKRN